MNRLLSDMLYMPAELAGTLITGVKTLTIGDTGYSEWVKADDGLILGFQKPAKARVIVLLPDSRVTYDSAIDQGDVYVAKGSYVEFAGYPGDVLKISAQ